MFDPQTMIPDLNVNKQTKQYNTRATHFTEIVYLNKSQVNMLSLVFKKPNLCPVMPASWGVTHPRLHTQVNCYQVFVYIVEVMTNQSCT